MKTKDKQKEAESKEVEVRPVIFHDTTSDEKFLITSAVATDEEGEWEDGKMYPLYKVEISSASHPFYTGKETIIDTAGRVDKFKARQQKAQSLKGPAQSKNNDSNQEVAEEINRVEQKTDTPSGKINADLKTAEEQQD